MKVVYTANVHSQTDPSKKYMVRRFEDGSWACSCPDSVMRSRQCKHIDRTIEWLEQKKAKSATTAPRKIESPTSTVFMQKTGTAVVGREQNLSISDIQRRLKEMGKQAAVKKARYTGAPKPKDDFVEMVEDILG